LAGRTTSPDDPATEEEPAAEPKLGQRGWYAIGFAGSFAVFCVFAFLAGWSDDHHYGLLEALFSLVAVFVGAMAVFYFVGIFAPGLVTRWLEKDSA
jgi:hypothetical protein